MARHAQPSEPEVAEIPVMAAEVSADDELIRLRNDRRIWKLALRYADGDHDLAEDALQETCWAILHMRSPERIENLEAYFRTVLKRTVADQCVYKSRAPVPAGDLEAVAAEVDRGGMTADAELSRDVAAGAILRVLASAWLDRLCSRREQLGAMLPDSSGNPGRYRDVLAATAEKVLCSLLAGSVSWADCNDAMKAAYPEWFAEPGCKQNTLDRRLSRARSDVRAMLKAVIGSDDLQP
jgi:hypothetical protein